MSQIDLRMGLAFTLAGLGATNTLERR